MTFETLKASILENVKLAQKNKINFIELYNREIKEDKENQFIFFIKPELTLENNNIKLDKILDLVFDKLAEFNLDIENVKVLGAKYLDKYNIISQHYGVINKLSNNPLEYMSEEAKNKLKEIANVTDLKECNVMGAFEFLNKYSYFNADSLDILWQNKEVKKLAGGTYLENVKVDTDNVYLINGFHPRQITHFTKDGRSIIVFTLSSNLSWTDARNKFIGVTNPQNAYESSLRRLLLERKEEFGIPEVSQGLNGFHLSAGPVEGLIELIRYNSDFSDNSKIKSYKDFSFGKKLMDNFSEEKIQQILNNVNFEFENKKLSVFDLTEEKCSNEAIKLLKKVF
ncbi:MAG: hypothetical protein KatS3mg068_0697 [Candidatus Sericytochromatia bacterium]|nr:MAG: hypothetical protein KatS3mg068_0697 [Candidatus Sericytochromatia bacterium]